MFLINESFVVYPTALPVLDEPVNNVEEILVCQLIVFNFSRIFSFYCLQFPEELRNIKELDDLFLTSEKFQLEKLNSIKTLNKPFFYVDGNVAAKRQSKCKKKYNNALLLTY